MQMIGTVHLYLKLNWFNCYSVRRKWSTMTHTTNLLIYADVGHVSFLHTGARSVRIHPLSYFFYLSVVRTFITLFLSVSKIIQLLSYD